MKHVFDDELFCSLKNELSEVSASICALTSLSSFFNELSEVSAQIDAQSAKLMGLIDQKKEYPLN